LRRFIGERVFDAVLVQREGASRDTDPVAPLAAALDGGASLILFPEGTRNTTAAPLLPFKSGLYRLARACPGVELVPVWIDNLNRVMPKGEFVPVPLLAVDESPVLPSCSPTWSTIEHCSATAAASDRAPATASRGPGPARVNTER